MESKIDLFLKYLDTEISRIEKTQTKPGWTRWALLGALGTCVWLASYEFEKIVFNWQHVSFLIISFFVLAETLRDINHVISKTNNANQQGKFFTIELFGYQIRRFSLLGILFYSLLLKAANDFTIQSLPFFRSICILIFAYNIILSAGSFVLSFSRLPIPTSIRPVIKNSHDFFSLVIDLYLLSSVLLSGSILISQLNMSEMRLVIIFGVIYWLLRILLDVSQENPLVESLRHIKSNLILERINLDSAKQQTDIALSGISYSEYLQKYVSDFLNLSNKIEQVIYIQEKECQHIQLLLKKKLSDKNIILIKSLFHSIRQHFEEIDQCFIKGRSILSKIYNQSKIIKVISTNTEQDLDALGKRLNESIDRLSKRSDSLSRNTNKIFNSSHFKRLAAPNQALKLTE